MPDLHSALKTSIIGTHTAGGIHYLLVRLQHGKDACIDTLHARPNTYSTAGFQSTDFLSLIGFRRSPCAFHNGECFCREVSAGVDLNALAADIGTSLSRFQVAERELEQCGLFIDQPEGWGYFHGRPPARRRVERFHVHGNGHVAPKTQRMKESEDEFFRFVFTWVEGGSDKGWTTHYRAKHMPLAAEFQSALDFLGGFKWFPDCPEFDFEGCWWRFTAFQKRGDGFFDSNVETAHRWFDAHASHFSPALRTLLDAHAIVIPWGMTFLPTASPSRAALLDSSATSSSTGVRGGKREEFVYDVAFSFAGTERALAEQIANVVRNAGFNVFFDSFYPEQLWGKDLVAIFDRIYRKDSRFCIMFLSREYAERIWTTHERRSATARALQERGNEYILPVKVEDVDIDGLAPTLGYISIGEFSANQIADLLIKKLSS